MKRRTKRSTLLASTLLAFALIVACVVTEVSPPRVSALALSDERIRFQITAVEESAGARKVICDAAVEGPQGTDFNVNLQDGRFRVSAKFMTDLAPGGGLTLRAKLDTRHFYGYSEAGLPLYEEDAQRHTLDVNFGEAVVLLPFGGGGDAGRLSIEITPARLPAGETTAPLITISKPSPGGVISVEATKVPHHFNVEATLLADGREVARGSAECLLEESCKSTLRPEGAEGASGALLLDLNVERYEPGSGSGRAAVRFDLFKDDPRQTGGATALARNWAGVANLGSEMSYDLSQLYGAASGGKYELKLRVDLARADAVGR